jgi:hypothetical protein
MHIGEKVPGLHCFLALFKYSRFNLRLSAFLLPLSVEKTWKWPKRMFVRRNVMKKISRVPVAHTCNPSYSGGSDQEDHSSKPAWANSLKDLISKKPFTQKDW